MKIRLGSDLIECLSWSLYENPIVLFREAIQNSIDAFKDTNNEWKNLSIDISLDAQARQVVVKDNGPGLSFNAFSETLGTMGESKKKMKNLAGCRGIGRLSGLGICDEIIFSSRSNSSKVTGFCRINAKGIREGLQKSGQNLELSEFLSNYILFSQEESQTAGNSFFSVTFNNVKRLAGDSLLNPNNIENYVTNIAPIPIEKTIIQFQNVENLYAKYNLPYGIKVVVNGGQALVKKFDDHKFLNINNQLEYEEHVIKNENDGVLGVAWFLHHDYLGALSSSAFRGLRFRHKNILIGNEDSFSCYFKESRFNRWTIGEVHPLTQGIRPSVKRDDFEPNEDFNKLVYKIRPLLFAISQRARRSSANRIQLKKEKIAISLKPVLTKLRRTVPKKVGLSLSRKKFIAYLEKVIVKSNGNPSVETIISCL